MMKKDLWVVVGLVAILIGGCATKRYGRMMPVTGAEGRVYSCEDIKVELSKIDAFELRIQEGENLDAASFMAAVGDLGIGNRMESNEALTSAKRRRIELNDLAASKGCP